MLKKYKCKKSFTKILPFFKLDKKTPNSFLPDLKDYQWNWKIDLRVVKDSLGMKNDNIKFQNFLLYWSNWKNLEFWTTLNCSFSMVTFFSNTFLKKNNNRNGFYRAMRWFTKMTSTEKSDPNYLHIQYCLHKGKV